MTPTPARRDTTSTQLVRPSLEVDTWTREQIEIATQGFAKDCTIQELEVFVQTCQRKGLDPWLGQIVAIKRAGKMIIQETVQGYRAVAERSGLYGGYRGPWWRSIDGDWDDVWLGDGYPAAAKIEVIRRDWTEPAVGVARWSSNVQMYWDPKEHKSKIVPIWHDRPDEMLAKTAEVRALKRAFSLEFAHAGLNTRDLTDAQVVAVESRAVGLDDQGRHDLVHEATGGRTDSSRDLTDDETLEVRGRLTAMRPDPDTGEICGGGDWATNERAFLASRIKNTVNEFDPDRRRRFRQWLDDDGVGADKPARDYTLDELYRVDKYLHGLSVTPPPPDPPTGDRGAPPDEPAGGDPPGDVARLWDRFGSLGYIQKEHLRAWMRRRNIPDALADATPDQITQVHAELDRRDKEGWPELQPRHQDAPGPTDAA